MTRPYRAALNGGRNMSKETIGHIDCPVCGHEMPVKADKNGHAYGHCAHSCNAQLFTRNDHRDAQLRKRMQPVTVTDPKPEPVTEPADPVQEPTAAPTPAPTSAPGKPVQKASFLSPLMGRATR
jgi:hypothetical protein